MSWLAGAYLWIKALHIIAVIAWMAGMLYLPRLFVYHADARPGSELSETLKVMERRLLKAIINPAMGAAFVLGILLLLIVDAWDQAWVWAKIVLVLAMGAVHGAYARWQRAFAQDRNTRAANFYRVWNEVPTLILIAIVIVIVVKPF